MRLASVRRSLFASEQARSGFLNALVTGTRDILRAQTGLREHGNYHEFCRLLGRLKTNYQLNELVRPLALLEGAGSRAEGALDVRESAPARTAAVLRGRVGCGICQRRAAHR